MALGGTAINANRSVNVDITSSNTTDDQYGAFFNRTQDTAATGLFRSTYGSWNQAQYTGITGTYDYLTGSYSQVTNNNAGTVTGITGVWSYAGNASTGIATDVKGVWGVGNNKSGTATNVKGGQFTAGNGYGTGGTTSNASAIKVIVDNTSNPTATIDVAKGLDLSAWTKSGTINTSYGIFMDTSIDVGTTKYALYSSSVSNSYLAGKVGIGSAAPTSTLTVAGSFTAGDATTTKLHVATGGSAGKLTCWKSDGVTIGYASTTAGNTTYGNGTFNCN